MGISAPDLDLRTTAVPTVSVIIPTRDYGRYIRQAVESIRRQTWTDWQCLVVDDGSRDDTREIVTELIAADPRIVYLAQESRGPSAARNAGLAAATGEFIQFLDADDVIGPRKIQRQMQLLAEHPEIDVVYGDSRYFEDGEMEPATVPAPHRWIDVEPLTAVSGPGGSVLPTLLRDNIMVVQAPLIRHSILERVGGFATGLRRMEDWECWLRCAMAGATFLWDDREDIETLSYVRVHASNTSQDRVAMLKAALQVRQLIQGHLANEQLRRLNDLRAHEQWADIGILEGLGGHPASGIHLLLRAGLEERRLKWLAWGLLIPFLRHPPGSQALRAWRGVKRLRRSRAWRRIAKPALRGGRR
jgi:glycosyltransferase involved in cell wall biosynthesis